MCGYDTDSRSGHRYTGCYAWTWQQRNAETLPYNLNTQFREIVQPKKVCVDRQAQGWHKKPIQGFIGFENY